MTESKATSTLSPFTGKYGDANEVTVLLVGALGKGMTNLALAIFGEARRIRMASKLPLDDDPGRSQIDFVVFVVRAHSAAESLAEVRESLQHLGAEYLHGRCCLAVCHEDHEAHTPSSPTAKAKASEEEEEEATQQPAQKKARSGKRNQDTSNEVKTSARGRGDRVAAAAEASAFSAKWKIPLVHGSVLTVAACKGLAASIAGLSRSPSGTMLLSCVV
jgi:hypothetical protein